MQSNVLKCIGIAWGCNAVVRRGCVSCVCLVKYVQYGSGKVKLVAVLVKLHCMSLSNVY